MNKFNGPDAKKDDDCFIFAVNVSSGLQFINLVNVPIEMHGRLVVDGNLNEWGGGGRRF